jgi:uroporphyrinogen-III synthase
VLVTRPAADATSLVAVLTTRGIEPLLVPLLDIRPAPDGAARLASLLPGAQAVLFTSANGARAFAAATPSRELAVFAVGDATAAAARAEGFARVESAGGDVEDLARLVTARLSPTAGALIHAAAGTVAGDLAGRLAAAGFARRRAVLYEAVPAVALDATARELLHRGGVDFALFFSPRTAATFVRLTAAGLANACRAVTAIALSPAVAGALSGITWRGIGIARRPNEAALLAALDAAIAERKATEGRKRGQEASA